MISIMCACCALALSTQQQQYKRSTELNKSYLYNSTRGEPYIPLFLLSFVRPRHERETFRATDSDLCTHRIYNAWHLHRLLADAEQRMGAFLSTKTIFLFVQPRGFLVSGTLSSREPALGVSLPIFFYPTQPSTSSTCTVECQQHRLVVFSRV